MIDARLAAASSSIQSRYAPSYTGRWANSPFKWMLPLPPASKGAAGVALFKNFLESIGYQPTPVTGQKNCICVNYACLKVKTSFEWEAQQFAFEQVRDQPYDYLCMLGIAPDDTYLWVLEKEEALRLSQRQHAEESRWFKGSAPELNLLLAAYGGDMVKGMRIFVQEVGAP